MPKLRRGGITSPPAEAPTPTTAKGLSVAVGSAGVAALLADPTVRRLTRGASGTRGERTVLPGRRLPVFVVTRTNAFLARTKSNSTRRANSDGGSPTHSIVALSAGSGICEQVLDDLADLQELT